MPHKFTAGRRGKIPRQKHQLTNWTEYNESLRRRDLTVWISAEAIVLWSASPRTTLGRLPVFADLCTMQQRLP